MPNGHVIHFLCYAISLDDEMYDNLEKHRDDRSYAQTMRDLVCTRLMCNQTLENQCGVAHKKSILGWIRHSKKRPANACCPKYRA